MTLVVSSRYCFATTYKYINLKEIEQQHLKDKVWKWYICSRRVLFYSIDICTKWIQEKTHCTFSVLLVCNTWTTFYPRYLQNRYVWLMRLRCMNRRTKMGTYFTGSLTRPSKVSCRHRYLLSVGQPCVKWNGMIVNLLLHLYFFLNLFPVSRIIGFSINFQNKQCCQ